MMYARKLKPLKLAAGVLVALLHAGCTGSGLENIQKGNPLSEHRWESRAERISIPFDWHNGHLIIEVRVNGSRSLRFAFDTGAAATVLFETERTRSTRLRIERDVTIGAGGGKTATRVNVVTDATISLEGLTLTGMSILHVPLASSPIFGSVDEAYFDGAIGYDLLRRFVTEIDYVGKTISFLRDPQSAQRGTFWQTLPIDVSGRVPFLMAQIQGDGPSAEEVKLLVDTGAPSYVYLNPDLTRGVDVPDRSYLTRGQGFNGPFERQTGRLGAFSMGEFRFDHLLAHFDRTDFKELGRGVGLIGNGVLRNFDLVLDYSAGTLSLRRNARFDPGSEADRSGIDMEPHRLGGIVRWVAKDSFAARIGLRSGDVITYLDGQNVEPANFDSLKKLLGSDRAGVEICWLSGQREVCQRLPLADRI